MSLPLKKRKRFEIGDVVEWRSNECVVTQLDPLKVRHISPGLNREHHAVNITPVDDWRARLCPNDDVEYYFEGFWIHSHVHSVNPVSSGIPFTIQPVFTRVLIDVYPHQIRRTKMSIPHRFEISDGLYGRLDQVLYDEEWYIVDKCTPLYVLTVDGHYLSRSAISGCLRHEDCKTLIGTIPFEHGTEFSDMLSIIESVSGMYRACWRHARHFLWRRSVPHLDEMVADAIDHFDTNRSKEILVVADYPAVYEMATWFEWRWCSIPYLQYEFHASTVDIYWTGCSPIRPYLMTRFVKPILSPLFEPRLALAGPPPSPPKALMDWQVPSVDSMSLLEHRNVCTTFCDHIGELMFSHYAGFILRDLPEVYGGVLCVDAGLGKTWMLFELFRRNPVRTLCVVPLCVLDHWVSIAGKMGIPVTVWHGTVKDSSGLFVLTTCRTLLRNPLDGFDRLILDEAQQVKCGSRSMEHLRNMDVKIRWYVSTTPKFKDCCTFLRVFPFTSEYRHDEDQEIPHAVWLSRPNNLDLSLVSVKIRPPPCWTEVSLTPSDENVLRYDPSLLAPELLHEEILVTSDTLANINVRIGRPVDMKSNCPVCLCEVTDAVVTQCGHVFCSNCSNKLIELGSNCPICRADLYPLTAVSSKPSNVFLINGRTYSRRDLSAGDLRTKLHVLDSPDTIFVTRSSVIRHDLKKYVSDVRLMRDCVGVHFDCNTLVFVDLYITDEGMKRVIDRLINPLEVCTVDIVTFEY